MSLLAGNIEAANGEGMHSFDQYLMQLLKGQYVTEDVARHYANNWAMVEMEMHGFVPSTSGILKPG
jgi:Tfp pilus assembly pilus retraction ATPase PilT